MAVVTEDRVASGVEPVPWWYERVVGASVVAVIGFSLAGMSLALIGLFLPGPVVALGFAVSYGLFSVWFRYERVIVPRSAPWAPPLAALAIAVASFAFNSAFGAETLLTDGEPGLVTNSARAIASEGDFIFAIDDGPFADARVGFDGGGFDARDGKEGLRSQVPHLFPLLAGVASFFGVSALLSTGALLGSIFLLSLFWFASRLLRPWLAVAVTGALALSLPFVQVSRSAYPEVAVGALVFAALGLVWGESEHLDPWRAAIAGLALGLTAFARPQWFLVALPVTVWVALEWMRTLDLRWLAARRRRLFLGALVGGYAAAAGIAAADVALNGLAVASAFDLQRLLLFLLPVVVGIGMGRLTGRLITSDPRRAYADPRRVFAVVLAVTVAGAGLFALYGRAVERVDEPVPAVVAAQQEEGVVSDPSRTYVERSAEWLGWYLGPWTPVLGVLGLAAMVAGLAWSEDRRTHLFLLVVLVTSAVVLADPDTPAVHIDVMSRLLPMAMPAALIGTVWVVDRTFSWRVLRPLRPIAIPLLVLLLLAPPLLETGNVATAASHRGLRGDLAALCGSIGRDGAVLIAEGSDDDPLGDLIAQPLRGFCGVPVARSLEPSPEEVDALRVAWNGEGRTLAVVTGDVRGGGGPAVLAWEALERRVESVPDDVVVGSVDLWVAFP